jgi:hypothetical protein
MGFRRPWLVAALVVAAAACSSPRRHIAAPGFANGSRLSVRYDEVGGARLWHAFYDSQRDEECAFQLLSDGGAACLPQSALLDGWFADGNCTEPVVEIPHVPSGRTPARAYVADPANACDAAPTVHVLGDVVPGPDAYYLRSDGTCMQNPPNSKIVLRKVGDEVALSSFVHATPLIENVSAALGAVVLVADDGARFNLFGHDPARDEWTRAVSPGDGTTRWWPVHLSYNYGNGVPGTPGAFFADSGCNVATGIKDAHNALCPITAVYEYVPGDACQQFTLTLHQAGAPVATADLHVRAGDGSCVGITPSADDATQLFVEMGDALPADAFPTATTLDVGDGRIVQRFDATPDGTIGITARGELHDRARDVDCFIGTAADGQRRCLPGSPIDSVFYADAGCSQPMMAMTVLTGCTTDPVPPREETFQGHAFAVGAALTPAMIYSKASDGSCGLVGAPPSYDRFFALGDEIPSSAYETATLHTD